jgi:hypothetical protein
MQVVTKGNELIITLDVSKEAYDNAPASKSGKQKLIATSHGFLMVNTPAGVAKLSLNLTR